MTKTYSATITITDDGAVHVAARSKLVFLATRRFTPTELFRLKEWLTNPATDWERDLNGIHINDTITYNQETGFVVVDTGSVQENFDPHSEEAWAKLVRKLKRRAPAPRSAGEVEIPELLPQPTEADLARRTILANVASASGIKGYTRPRAGQTSTLSPEASKAKVNDILGLLAAKRRASQ